MKDLFGNEIVETCALSRDFITQSLINELRGVTDVQLAAMLTNKVEAIVDFAALCNGKRSGQKISLLFNPHRLNTATNKSKSIVESLNDGNFCSGLARALAWKNGKVTDLLYQCIQLGINGVQYVNEFPPHIARDVYMFYGSKRILDPCAGWGGRMIGAASIGAFYHGFEPATKTYDGLMHLGDFLKSFNTGFDFKIECLPFEDAEIVCEYDIALTSPPYYDTEHYSDEMTQARMKFASYDDFVSGFLLPMVEKASRAAKNGLVLNVGSRQYPMRSSIENLYRTENLTAFRLSGRSGLGKQQAEGELFLRIANRELSAPHRIQTHSPRGEPGCCPREKYRSSEDLRRAARITTSFRPGAPDG
jgi:hypothetical protein